ncbi:uncharacterized protein [Porites lutea]|uniref:uncharacterized protein n=1 Tax=Porites lutea TaxID=51062 RepID=UPI003CC6229B
MAALDDAEETLRSTRTKANFQRLTRLLMSGGAVLLREIFDSYHSPASLPTILSKPSVERQLKTARLTGPDWKCLYPSPGVYGKSSDFGISLTFRLLRTICPLTPPLTGWDSLPNDSDHSLEADIVRIKFYRNEADDQFDDLWRQMSEALLRIAANLSPQKQSNWKNAIDKFLLEPLTPEEEVYAKELELWYEKDLDLKKALKDLKELIHEEFREMKEKEALRATLRLMNNIAQFGFVVTPGEMEENQREIQAELDMWNVIMAFKNSFRLLFRYLKNNLNALVEDIELGSLLITVKCSSLQILKGLWKVYKSGYLNQVVQETLVTHEVLEIRGIDEVKLMVSISEQEYEKGKQIFADNSVGETAAGDEKLLKDLPSEGYQKLVEHLQPLSATGRDYRSLADRMGYSNQFNQWLGSTDNPVMNLLRKFRENDEKISELTSLLKEMERYDVLEDLQPYIVCGSARWTQHYTDRLKDHLPFLLDFHWQDMFSLRHDVD